MSARLLSYQVAADNTFSSVKEIVKNYVAGTTSVSGYNVPTSDEPNIAAAIAVLSNQVPGGNIITEITTPGGVPVKWNETLQEVKIGALTPWPKAIGQSYQDVIQNGLDN